MKAILCFFSALVIFVQLSLAQGIILNNTFTEDTTLQIFNETPTFYSLKIKCNATLYTDSSLVRVILKDLNDNEYMIYENYKLIENSYSNIDNFAEETFILPATVAKEIIIQVFQSSIFIESFTVDTLSCSYNSSLYKNHVDSVITNKINEISNSILENKMLWFAGRNSISDLSYSQKKVMFGDKYNLEGFDYYIGGLFIRLSIMNLPVSAEKSVGVVIDDFDWRKKHGANDPNSPYFDGDPDWSNEGWFDPLGNWTTGLVHQLGNGWMTGVRNQYGTCGNGCYAFSPIAAFEATINLYYNQHLDYNLSEQQAIVCAHDIYDINHDCYTGASPTDVEKIIKFYGLSSEICFPWLDGMVPCGSYCNPPDYIIQASDFTSIGYISTSSGRLQFKKDIIRYGPHTINTTLAPGSSSGSHSMCVMGFGKVREGQILHCGNGYPPPGFPNPLIVTSGNPLIGQTYWILKNSGGAMFGDKGYMYLVDYNTIAPQGAFSGATRFNTPIIETGRDDIVRCDDLDGDGYFNWGIGSKPSDCICPIEEDCDDSNPFLGPMDPITYDCTVICDNFLYEPTPMIISSDDSWNDQKLINKDIMIEPGVTLNILNTVKMASDAKIIVKQGGKLIINGGDITSACDYLWKGIEVWGDKTLRQFPETNQGVVEIINGGTIENAVAAIRTLNTGDTHPLDFTGGIIRADGANFINNYSGIYIAPYHNHLTNGALTGNRSYIQNCTFESNSVLNDPTLNPTSFICLNDVEGIIIKGNTFKNTNPAATTPDKKGNGIYAYNASCTINEI